MAMGDQNDMLARLKAVLPRWFGAASTALDGVMTGMAYVGSFIYGLYAYLVLQTRIKTATDGNLDMVAADFFGPTIMRSQGQTDGSFRAAIIANLFRERGTRAGMTKMLLDVTGRAATCVEPGNPGQVGAYSSAVTVSRGAYATYYDNNGILQTAPPNTPRYSFDPANLGAGPSVLMEAAAVNVLAFPTQFDNAAWSKVNATVTANAATAPDGTLTADKLVEDTSNNQHYVAQNSNQYGNTFTASIYVKAAERTRAFIRAYKAANVYALVDVDLTSGKVLNTSNPNVASLTYQVQALTNGWYRVSVTGTSTYNAGWELLVNVADGTEKSAYSPSTYTGDGTSGIYIWGAQLEAGGAMTSFIPPQANLLKYAAQFNLSPWGNDSNSCVLTPNAASAPDGTLTATHLAAGTNAGLHDIYQSVSLTNGATYTWSVYGKAAENSFIALAGLAGNTYAYFDLTTGTVTKSTGIAGASSVNVGNGWWRLSVTFVATSTSGKAYIFMANSGTTDSYTGDGAAGVYVWGAQHELGSAPSTLLLTGASPLTRDADVETRAPFAVAGYGVAGAWGTVQYPGTVLITAYLPDGSNGVAAGSLTAQDIYNAVEAVRPIGSTCWVSVQS